MTNNESETKICKCDYDNPLHLQATAYLINLYIQDEMGGGETLNDQKKKVLLEQIKKHTSSIIILAMTGNDFSGICVSFENVSTFSASPMINIHDVFVTKKYRGKGIGKKLMEKIIEIAQTRNCSRVTLEVREDNIIAQNLYRSLGFDETEPPMLYWRKYINL